MWPRRWGSVSNREVGGYYTFDSVEAASCLSYRCIQAGTRIMNCVRVEDVMFREEAGVKRVCGLVINWSPVKSLDLHVDPLSVGPPT